MSTSDHPKAYRLAQRAIAELKASVALLLANAPADGLTNATIGRMLGIYAGHVGHVGHIPRTLLALMENEGVVTQGEGSKKWRLRSSDSPEPEEP